MPKQTLAKVIPIDSKRAPKACIWKVRYAQYSAAGVHRYECLVFNYDKGLTAFEAWDVCSFPTNPAFYECTFESLCDYPCSDTVTELKTHGTYHRKNGSRFERVRAILTGQDGGITPKVPHPS